MQKIDLFTTHGDQVARVDVPDFRDFPGIIVWGQRSFAFHPVSERWEETFVYHVPVGAPSSRFAPGQTDD